MPIATALLQCVCISTSLPDVAVFDLLCRAVSFVSKRFFVRLRTRDFASVPCCLRLVCFQVCPAWLTISAGEPPHVLRGRGAGPSTKLPPLPSLPPPPATSRMTPLRHHPRLLCRWERIVASSDDVSRARETKEYARRLWRFAAAE
eukprot:6199690-Pleurochrysis_carterae.AAC.1